MRWMHELVWLALAVTAVTILTLWLVSILLGPNTGGLG